MRTRIPRQGWPRRVRTAWAPSLTRRIVRSRSFAVAVVAVVGGLALASLQQRMAEADAARSSWGESVSVVVVTERVSAGAAIAGAVRVDERPEGMVPQGALDVVPPDALAAVDLVPGELLLRERVVGGPTGLRPAGTVAVTVAIDGEAALVAPGDLVDLWSTDIATLTSEQVVAAVVVLDRQDSSLTIAVPEEAMADVAVASLRPLTVAQR